MFDYISIGPVPNDEKCVQVNQHTDYLTDMKTEALRYLYELEKRFPTSAEHNVYFAIKHFNHEAGLYIEVIVKYFPDNIISRDFALFVERNLPSKWSDKTVFSSEQFAEYRNNNFVTGDIISITHTTKFSDSDIESIITINGDEKALLMKDGRRLIPYIGFYEAETLIDVGRVDSPEILDCAEKSIVEKVAA